MSYATNSRNTLNCVQIVSKQAVPKLFFYTARNIELFIRNKIKVFVKRFAEGPIAIIGVI